LFAISITHLAGDGGPRLLRTNIYNDLGVPQNPETHAIMSASIQARTAMQRRSNNAPVSYLYTPEQAP
jgi:hypothetical protein